MALTLVSRAWQDKDGNLSPISSVTLSGAFGEERVLTLNYSFDQQLDGCEIFFNPALFIEQGILLEQSQTLPPNVAYWYKVTASTTTAVEHTMNLLNSNATERNISVTFELNADRLSFTIRLTCFLTADILAFLNDNGIDNSIRLLGNTKDADEIENLEDSVYSTDSKGIGVHTGVKVPDTSALCGTKGAKGQSGVVENEYLAAGELFAVRFAPYSQIDKLEIFVNGVLTASSGTDAGDNFGAINGFDGNAGAGYPLGAHPDPPVVPNPNKWYVGNFVSFNNRLADFQSDTGFTANLIGYQQIIWAYCNPGDTITVRVAGTSGTAWDYEIYCPSGTEVTIPGSYDYDDGWISSEFIFLNEGTMTNPVFELSRNSEIVTDFASFADTDITLRIDHTSAITQAKVWVIDADNTKQTLDFKKAYGYDTNNYFDAAVPSNVSGNTYETSFVINKDKLTLSGRYFIIAVYYDSENEYVASYISDAIFVTNVQFLTPTVTGTIYNLVADLQSNYVEVSPLQRICCQITLDKYTGFDAAYLGGVLNVNGQNVSWFGKNNQGDFVFSDSSGSLIIRYYLRVEEDWQAAEIDILWNINFNVEYTTISFPQRIAVTQMEQNKATPNLTEIKLYKDGVTLLEEGDSACDANFIRVETIKDASAADYAQAAIWKDENGNVYEEEAWSPISVFTQASNAFQSDVEVYFSDADGADDVSHKITNEVTNGKVGMIGYPPPLPLYFMRHPVHITTTSGRSAVFIVEKNYGVGRTMAFIGGFSTSDFSFRVGNASTDANDNSWSAFSDLTFAQFAALPIIVGQHVRVQYNGSSTKTDISAYIECRMIDGPVNPKIVEFTIENLTAANDFIFWTGLNMNFQSLASSGGTIATYSNKRTASELANSFNLTDYENGLSEANYTVALPNNINPPHIYLERTNDAAPNISIKINQIENANIEIGNPATPLRNKYYPLSGTGVNPQSVRFDLTNDYCRVSNNNLTSYFDFATMPDDSYIEILASFKFQAGGNANARRLISLTAGGNDEFGVFISLSGTLLFAGTIISVLGFSNQLRYTTRFINNRVYNMYFRMRKKNNNGGTSDKFHINDTILIVDTKANESFTTTSSTTAPLPSFASDNLYVSGSNLAGGSVNYQNAMRSMVDFGLNVSLSPRIDIEEAHRYCRGDLTISENMDAKYLFSNINNATGEIPNTGTNASLESLIMIDHTNTTNPLF